MYVETSIAKMGAFCKETTTTSLLAGKNPNPKLRCHIDHVTRDMLNMLARERTYYLFVAIACTTERLVPFVSGLPAHNLFPTLNGDLWATFSTRNERDPNSRYQTIYFICLNDPQ
jgi:hypothetical protein